MGRVLGPVAALIVILSLAACGGGGDSGSSDSSSSAGDPQNYLPMAVGDRWVYQVTEESPFTGNKSFQQMTTISGTKIIEGMETKVQQTRNLVTNELLGETHLGKTNNALTEYFEPGNTPFGQPLDSVTLLQLPLQMNETFLAHKWLAIDSGADWDGDGQNERLDARMIVTVENKESVSVPAGDFDNALKTSTLMKKTLTYSTGAIVNISIRTNEWLVSGLGIVKRQKITTYPAGTETATYELTGYAVAGERSETDEPEVVQSQPDDDTINAWTSISLNFDEALDMGRINDQSLTLVNDNDQPVSGSLSFTSQQISFSPSTPLPPGTYTATTSNMFDILGNKLPPYSWTFTVDTSLSGDPLDYQPMAVGNRWIYKVTESDGVSPPVTSMQMEMLTGTKTVAGTVALIQEIRDVTTNALSSEAYLVKTNIAINQLFESGNTPLGLPVNSITLLRLPLLVNEPYQTVKWLNADAGRDYDGDGLNESLDELISVTVLGKEAVSLSTRNYANTLKVFTQHRQILTGTKTGGTAEIIMDVYEWMVPGLGTVKRVLTVSSPGFHKTTVLELTDYSVAGQRSESFAPYATLPQPSPYGTNKAPADVSLDFNEPLDLGRLHNQSFTLVGGNGQPISGSLSLNSQQIRFTPTQPLADGTYTATITGVFDLLGNSMPNYTWTFTVDTTRPVVLSTSPADGARNVLTYGGISVNFSEPMPDYWSLTAPYVQISGVDTSSISARVDDGKLTLSPGFLAHGTTYNVTLGTAITDRFGNSLASPYNFSFTTLPAVFEPAANFFETWGGVQASAIGDVNGDGRNDFVMVTGQSQSLSNTDAITLFVFLQNADHTLAAPTRYITDNSGNYACTPSSVAIGDVTGDGNTDIVVGENGCGLKVFQRTAGGDWPRPARMVSPDTKHLRLGDMNNDGRLDIVGVGGATNTVTVWYQQSGGGLGAPTPYSINHTYYEDMALGDINGDGLQDIVVTSANGPVTTSIAMMTQSGSGGFNLPIYYGTGSLMTMPSGAAVGDVNNDGRHDVVIAAGGNGASAKIGIFYQQSNGSLGPLTLINSYEIPSSVKIADINSDGRSDIVAIHSSYTAVGLYLQDSNGQLKTEDLYGGGSALALGDLNGDGFSDVVMAYYRKLSILYNVGH